MLYTLFYILFFITYYYFTCYYLFYISLYIILQKSFSLTLTNTVVVYFATLNLNNNAVVVVCMPFLRICNRMKVISIHQINFTFPSLTMSLGVV